MEEREHPSSFGGLDAGLRFPGLERLMSAALAEPDFAAQLLADPAAALEHVPPAVQLSAAERALVASVTGASDIHDFAARLHARIQQTQTGIA